MRLIHDLASAALERLDRQARAPVAVAISGGADSLAALIATVDWARRCGRPVLALSVDHRLQAAGGAWTAQAGDAARRLGAGFQALAWDGPKPATGLPAAARAARHRLLAQAARAAGCSVLVTGHTLDDVRENALMGLGPITEWSPSPVWPEGRELFLLRPLLTTRCAALRGALAQAGWSWVDDPANDNPAHPRSRARLAVQAGAEPKLRPPAEAADLARTATFEAGAIILQRGPVEAAAFEAARRAIAAAAVCAGGVRTSPRGRPLDRMTERLRTGEVFSASLTGARVQAGGDIVFAREAGESARGGLAPLKLGPGERRVWDGRFEIEAAGRDIEVRRLGGLFGRLSYAERRALGDLAPALRPPLPAIVGPDGDVACPILAGPILAGASGVRVRSLVEGRFLAACGVFLNERSACDAVRVAKRDPRAYLETQQRLAAKRNKDLKRGVDVIGVSGLPGERGEIHDTA